jgi:hypothetical protein
MRRTLVALALPALVALSGGCHHEEKQSAAPAPQAKTPTSPSRPKPPNPLRYPAPVRLVAIGDLHGDLGSTRAALRLAGAINSDDDWIGGKLVVVQVGDELDRGDQDREILELFGSLKDKAKKAGGRVIALDGNHEVMNVQGDFRYTTHGGFEEFKGSAGAQMAGITGRFPPIARGRAVAFHPGGEWARRLAKRSVVAIVGDSVFVHGGLLPKHVGYGLDRINAETSAWMRGQGELPTLMQREDAPIWLRAYSEGEPDAATCSGLHQVLHRLHARRMVVGHTVQKDGITSACNGGVWRIDVGLSDFYGGPTQVLEIDGDGVKVLGKPAQSAKAAE